MNRLLASLALAALATAAGADVLVIENATVHPVTSAPLPNAHVRVVDGRIAEVGPGADTSGADRRIDATGLHVYPGLFASIAQVGMVEVSGVSMVNDTDEGNSPNTALLRASDAYNPNSELIATTRMNGITHALVAPSGGNVFTGQGAVVELAGLTLDQALVLSPASLHVTLGEEPKERFGAKNTMPSTRMGLAAHVRGELEKARLHREKIRRHADKLARHERDLAAFPGKLADWEAKPEVDRGDRPEPPEPPDPMARDLGLEALVRALDGQVPTVFEAYRLDDIETALRLSDEFGLRPILVGATSAWRVADRIAERGIPVIVAATHQPSSLQAHDAAYENAAILHAAGVQVAFLSGDRTHNLRNLPYEAGLAVAHGMDKAAALEALTINPARIWGLEAELGSIEPGKRANLIVTDGDPLQPLTKLSAVVIDGEQVELRSRQQDLAEQWGGDYLPQ